MRMNVGDIGKRLFRRKRAARRTKEDALWHRLQMLLSFLLPFLIMLCLFAIRGIYPFGDRSFLFSDMWHQYMPFFQEFLHKIKAGEGLSYSYQVGIGSNFLALYVYYLASPLNWLAFLVSEAHLMEFMSYLVIVKLGLCGLTFYIYLRGHFRTVGGSGPLFACFYALSGFTAAYNWNIMWLDCVVLLPLILLGLEQLVKEGKWKLYCVTLALSILTNYYISIMICIFLVLYFVMLFLTEKHSLRIIRDFVVCSLLAGGLAAVLLVPEVLAILETDFGDMDFPAKVESYFSVLDMLARHCMAVMTERKLDHWPNIYCGVAVFLLLPLYAVCKKIPMRRRFGYLALAGIMLLGFSTNVLDFIWHGLNYPDSLPARQSFIYIFLILIMCYAVYRQIDRIPKEHILYVYLGAIVALLLIEKFVEHEDFLLGVEWLNVLFVTFYAVLFYLRRTRRTIRWRDGLTVAALVVVVAETGINTFATSVGTTSRSQYLGHLPDYADLYEAAREDAGMTFFRLEKFSRKTKNDATLAGFPSASVFSSTMNSYVMDLYERWGMRHSKVYYGFDGATFLTSALLNVQYMFGELDQEEGPLYELLQSNNGITLYRDVAALPFGYVAPAGYDLSDGFENNGLRLQNNMVNELGIVGPLFTKTDGGTGERLTLTAEEDGYYYGLLTAYGTSDIDMAGKIARTYGDLKKGSVLYLGYLEAGEGVSLTNGNDSDSSPDISVDFYRMDEEILEKALEMLGKEHLTNVVYDSTHLTGEITLSEAGRLILSIPYEKGWTVEVDGEKVEPGTFGGTLMAFELEAGNHSLAMRYVPNGKYAGIAISAGSILLLIGWSLFQNHQDEKRRKQDGERVVDRREDGDGSGDESGKECGSGEEPERGTGCEDSAGEESGGSPGSGAGCEDSAGEEPGGSPGGAGEDGAGAASGVCQAENQGSRPGADDSVGFGDHGGEPEELR